MPSIRIPSTLSIRRRTERRSTIWSRPRRRSASSGVSIFPRRPRRTRLVTSKVDDLLRPLHCQRNLGLRSTTLLRRSTILSRRRRTRNRNRSRSRSRRNPRRIRAWSTRQMHLSLLRRILQRLSRRSNSLNRSSNSHRNRNHRNPLQQVCSRNAVRLF